jgi:hypothetical protein
MPRLETSLQRASYKPVNLKYISKRIYAVPEIFTASKLVEAILANNSSTLSPSEAETKIVKQRGRCEEGAYFRGYTLG